MKTMFNTFRQLTIKNTAECPKCFEYTVISLYSNPPGGKTKLVGKKCLWCDWNRPREELKKVKK